MVDEGFLRRFFEEIQSYAPIVIPSLVIYVVESRASLKLWYATKQTPKPEPLDPSVDAAAKAKRTKAILKAERRGVSASTLFVMLLFIVLCVHQYLEIRIYLAPKKDDEKTNNFYLNSDIVGLSWVDILYGSALFVPTVAIIINCLSMFTGMKERVVHRNDRGRPFIVMRRSAKPLLRFPKATFLFSIMITVGAFWLRSKIAIGAFYGASVYALACSSIITKSISTKAIPINAAVMTIFMAIILSIRMASSGDERHYRIFNFFSTSEINWAGLMMSITWSSAPLTFISLCYRLDHYVSESEEAVIESQLVKGAIAGAEDLVGTVVPHGYAAFKIRPRFRKYYFHAALFGWLASFPVQAALIASGYFEGGWEFAGAVGTFTYPLFMATFVFTIALLRGHVRKLWNYKEDWGTPPSVEDGLNLNKQDEEILEKEEENLVYV